jgi:methionine-rich copper-binding protein CopC
LMDETLTNVAGLLLTVLAVLFGKRAFAWAKLFLERRKPAADVHLTDAQAEVQLASSEKLRAEVKGDLLDRALAMLDRTERKVERLETEITYWRERAEQAESELLRKALKEPLPKPGNGKGN